MGQDPKAADNRWLREASEHWIPIMYFLGIAPEPLRRLDSCLHFRVGSGDTEGKRRVRSISAYNGRCALSGLPEPLLLDAAHILADKDEQFGHPVAPNGIPLSKIHHAAFDAHLIGIDPRPPDSRFKAAARAEGRPNARSAEATRRGRDDPPT